MKQRKSDDEIIRDTHNTARFFTENRHIAWVLLIAVLLWGVYGYLRMPKRKDPEIPVRTAVAICPWPGKAAEQIEELVTRTLEKTIAENSSIEKIESVSRTGISVVYVTLLESVEETGKQFDDIQLKLGGIHNLPAGAGPISFIKDYGDTAALMLTVASPRVSGVELDLRATKIEAAIRQARAKAGQRGPRVSVVVSVPQSLDPRIIERRRDFMSRFAEEQGLVRDILPLAGPGFVGVDAATNRDDAAILTFIKTFIRERLHEPEFHPDAWQPAIIRNPGETRAKLAEVAGFKYSYRELDNLTDLIQKTLQTSPYVSKASRSGVLEERIFLEYSQERMASYGFQPSQLRAILDARNTVRPGGVFETRNKSVRIDPSGEFRSEKEIGEVLVSLSESGVPVYLRDGVEIIRDYESPPRYLNFYTYRDEEGNWQRSRAITIALQMRSGEQIDAFGQAVDALLEDLKRRLPGDLIIARTSDQPLQVRESVNLFLKSLYEAIILVILVSLIGFWDWRSALLMALSIPVTLAMTFGFMSMLGIDIQQASIASLIIALGLLVDDPVVAGDAIKRELAEGRPPIIASWLGPTKLAKAILFATITNSVAYLPLLLVSGDVGRFVYSLPVVVTSSLVASRIVSMTFIPLLGYYLLRPGKKQPRSMEDRRTQGFSGKYYALGGWLIDNRVKVLFGSLVFLVLGGLFMIQLRTQFFPKDLSYLSYVDVWLPEDAPIAATREAARKGGEVIVRTTGEYGAEHTAGEAGPRQVLESITTFVGGGGPRFWFSVAPEMQQPNYAQLIIEVKDKHDTDLLTAPLQHALSRESAGARMDMRQLESGKPVGIPVSVRISGLEIAPLRELAERMKNIFRSVPDAHHITDDWGAETFTVKLQVDQDRANLSGVTNEDVAISSSAAINGLQVATLREGDKQIPVLVRMRMEERARISDIRNLYVYSQKDPQKTPLGQVSSLEYKVETEKLRRRNQFRTITVSAFPIPGVLPSEIMSAIKPRLEEFRKALPPGYRMEIGGEEEEQIKGFKQLVVVMAVSITAIFVALVFQFNHAAKPLIVFSAIPFGMVGALAGLAIMGAPFGFMAFLGIASLVGVIVSHIIVLFDFIEEMHEKGEPLREALLDAGIIRLRPVMITVGSTVLALIPLALHGGPLWQPVTYAQIGGLTVATFVTLLLVPVLYAIFVLDLKIVKWERKS